MARPRARVAPAGLWLLAAAAAAAQELAGSVERSIPPWDFAEDASLTLLHEEEEADDAKGNHTNKTEHLKAEIAWLKQQLQHEAWRMQSAESSTAEANATWQAEEAELKRVRAETANATEHARRAWHEVAQVQEQIKAMNSSSWPEDGPVTAWVSALPYQRAIAILLGVAGLLSIVGPSTFTRAFLAISGSAVGGLLVASCFDFLLGDASWLGAVRGLLKGTGFFVGYGLWAVFFALGMVRWLVGFKCGPEAPGDEDAEESPSQAAVAGGGGLRQPLLAAGEPARPPPPPSRPRSGRGSARGPVQRDAV